MKRLEGLTKRTERTRAALIAAGKRLFSGAPVDAVSIDEITQAAKVAKGSFYNHFTDREAFAAAIGENIRVKFESAVDERNASVVDPALRVARAMAVYFRIAVDDIDEARLFARLYAPNTSLTAPLNRGLVQDISAGQRLGRFAIPSIESGVLLVYGAAQMCLARLIQNPAPTLASTLTQQMCALSLRGLGVSQEEAEEIALQARAAIVDAVAEEIGPGATHEAAPKTRPRAPRLAAP